MERQIKTRQVSKQEEHRCLVFIINMFSGRQNNRRIHLIPNVKKKKKTILSSLPYQIVRAVRTIKSVAYNIKAKDKSDKIQITLLSLV